MIPEILLASSFALGFSNVPVPAAMHLNIKTKPEYIFIETVSQTNSIYSIIPRIDLDETNVIAIPASGKVLLEIDASKKTTLDWF